MRSTRLATRALAVVTLTASGLIGFAAGPGASGAYAAAPASVRIADEEATTPLRVTMTRLTPSTIPARGQITITGIVENLSEDDWTDVNVSPFVSAEPLTTRDELTEAAASASDATVGERLTAPDVQVSLGDLGPGQRATFTIRVAADELPITGDPGVYWIGVHALGATSEGRDTIADGRVRTFIPLVPQPVARRRTVPVSVVLPLRERARRAVDGSLNGPARWVNLTRPDGRLSRLADFAASAGAAPVTWLLDPAVLDALSDFGRGNPPLSLGPANASDDGEDDGDGEGDDGPGSSPSPSPTAEPVSGAPSEAQQGRATTVLEGLLANARGDTVLNLGYADPDVVSLVRRGPNLLRRSDDLSQRSMRTYGLTATPVVSPPQGYFDPELLASIPSQTLLLLGDHGDLEQPTLSRLPTGQELVLSDQRAGTGGPSPTLPRTALAMRQRILAEAALEATKGDEPVRPVVVTLPPRWNPGTYWREADFFDGLRVPWVRLDPVTGGATTPYDADLPYPKAQQAQEVRASNVAATRTLAHTATVLGHLLANDNEVADKLTGAALQASSYSAKPVLGLAAAQVLDLDDATREQMDRVQVIGTEFVTLSGGSGALTVTLVNGLEQPITVGLQARTDSSDVTVEAPEPVSLQAGQRSTLRLQVNSRVGVHEVTLFPVTTQGERAGTPLTFSLRTSQVGRLIWYIIAAGGLLLAVMIVRRIVLRIRLNRWRVRDE